MASSCSSAPSPSWYFSALSLPLPSSSSSSPSSSGVSSSARRPIKFIAHLPSLPPPSSEDSLARKPSESKSTPPTLPLPLTAAACCLFALASSSPPHSAAASASQTASSVLEEWISREPSNALSLPTWAIHVASVAEWVIAMALVWEYGDKPGNAAWKGLSWGMVPLLGGAMCACTWHFFYNAPSLEVLVFAQAGLTFLGNFTMWLAAYRIYRSSLNKELEK